MKHPVVHYEIGCHDGEKTREFFAGLFDWEISGADSGMMIGTGDAGRRRGHSSALGREWGN